MSRRQAPTVPVVRCSIYTRKSTEEGLEQAFNTLDAQRESGEAYIKSQASEGWECVADRFDDGGYTGANTERPALKRLLGEVEAGRIDCVVVYKVDRLSRSLLDFAKLMELFEKHNVAFVSVTQRFDTSSSMGRLMMNVLLSFAQFEREIVSERTRDKIYAARRKGKWAGGSPLLGYDIDRKNCCLVVNEDEAERVRQIFKLYLKHESLIPTARAIEARGWVTKRWTTKTDKERGGRPIDKGMLYNLLTNVAYLGKVRHRDEVFEGQHEAIIDLATWQRVQEMLARNRRNGGSEVRNKYGALLKGILHCTGCNCSMGHSYSQKRNKATYRYYVCLRAQKQGWDKCAAPSLPAAEIERIVVEQIRRICRAPELLDGTLKHARRQAEEQTSTLRAERAALERELKRTYVEVQRLAGDGPTTNGAATARLADLNERIRLADQRRAVIDEQLEASSRTTISEGDVRQALTEFDPLWESLSPKERARVVKLLVKRVDYDSRAGKASVTFHPTGLRCLADRIKQPEVAA
jgi:site-specific DNA recombinase